MLLLDKWRVGCLVHWSNRGLKRKDRL